MLDHLDITISEYGFSRAMLELCPESWKDLLGCRWKDVLTEIILAESPHSYLKKERNPKDLRVHLGCHRRLLQDRMPVRIEHMWALLSNIWIIQGNQMNGLPTLNPEQLAFCEENHIRLEVMS